MSTEWKFTDCKDKPLLLFSCLDWGLGHTTRSVPLINELLVSGCDLIVACNSTQKVLLQAEFIDLKYVELPGYDLSYGSGRWATRLKIIAQISKILMRIKSENAWLKALIRENKVDGLISDNRYGLYHPQIPSVFITHQLHVHSGYGSYADSILQKFLYRFINRFTVCWVPDFKKRNSLAGLLSHPETLPDIPVQYLGAISRFNECTGSTEKKFDLLILISGPEPQRTILEKMMIEQSERSDKKIALVRGLPGDTTILEHKKISIFNHLNGNKLNKLICESELVICRSGYTTIMDMVKLKKKMIVIPTPGQSEQEYLAGYLSQNHFALSIPQNAFTLDRALELAANFSFTYIDTDMNEYKAVIKEFVQQINSLSPSSTR